MRQVCKSNIGVFREMLQKSFGKALESINDNFVHEFSNENPEFSFTIKVDGHQFTALVAEVEYSKLKKAYVELQRELQEVKDKLAAPHCPRCGYFLMQPEGEPSYCTKCQWEDV